MEFNRIGRYSERWPLVLSCLVQRVGTCDDQELAFGIDRGETKWINGVQYVVFRVVRARKILDGQCYSESLLQRATQLVMILALMLVIRRDKVILGHTEQTISVAGILDQSTGGLRFETPPHESALRKVFEANIPKR